jgi:hypothetical protein
MIVVARSNAGSLIAIHHPDNVSIENANDRNDATVEESALLELVDELYLAACDNDDVDTMTVGDVHRAVAIRLGTSSLEKKMKKIVKARLTDLITPHTAIMTDDHRSAPNAAVALTTEDASSAVPYDRWTLRDHDEDDEDEDEDEDDPARGLLEEEQDRFARCEDKFVPLMDRLETFKNMVTDGCNSDWAGIVRQFVPSRDNVQVGNHAKRIHPEKKEQLLREHEKPKPPAGIEQRKWAPWSTEEIEGFDRSVIALGWSDWAGIVRQFVPSRDNVQARNHALGIHPEKKKQLLREHEKSKPPAGIEQCKWVPWSTEEIEGFDRGVIALGWSNWAGIVRQFVPSRDNVQARNHALGIHPEKRNNSFVNMMPSLPSTNPTRCSPSAKSPWMPSSNPTRCPTSATPPP